MKLYFYSIQDNEKYEKVLHCQEVEVVEKLKIYKIPDGMDFWPYRSSIKKDELNSLIGDSFGINFGVILDLKDDEKAKKILSEYVENKMEFYEKNIRYLNRLLKAVKDTNREE